MSYDAMANTYCMSRVPPNMRLCQNRIPLVKGDRRFICDDCKKREEEQKNAAVNAGTDQAVHRAPEDRT